MKLLKVIILSVLVLSFTGCTTLQNIPLVGPFIGLFDEWHDGLPFPPLNKIAQTDSGTVLEDEVIRKYLKLIEKNLGAVQTANPEFDASIVDHFNPAIAAQYLTDYGSRYVLVADILMAAIETAMEEELLFKEKDQ